MEADERARPSEIHDALTHVDSELKAYLNQEHTLMLASCSQAALSSFANSDVPKLVRRSIKKVRELDATEQVSPLLDDCWSSRPEEVIVQLVPTITAGQAERYFAQLSGYLERRDSGATWISSPSDGFLTAPLVRQGAEELLRISNFVFYIEPLPVGVASKIRTRRARRTAFGRGVLSSFGPSMGSLPLVCVADTGVNEVRQLRGLISSRDKIASFSTVDDEDGRGHGTAVACLTAFGEDRQNPRARIISHKIYGAADKKHPLRGNFEAVRQHSSAGCRIFVSSVNEPMGSLRTLARLDNLIQDRNVCFVNSAGNVEDLDYLRRVQDSYPNFVPDRPVFHPSQNMSVVSVGAVALKTNQESLAPRDGLSPFTRCGTELSSAREIRKPDLVEHGGNMARNTFDYTGLGLPFVDSRGNESEGIGTSLAAPLVAGRLAEIEKLYGGKIENCETMKAILFSLCSQGGTTCHGYGRPDLSLLADRYHVIVCSEGRFGLAVRTDGDRKIIQSNIISFRVPRAVDEITLWLVHSDNLPAYIEPTLNTSLKVKATKDGRLSPVDLVQESVQSLKSYVKCFNWPRTTRTKLGRWQFEITAQTLAPLDPTWREKTIVRYGCVFVLRSLTGDRIPMTEAFLIESKRSESVVIA